MKKHLNLGTILTPVTPDDLPRSAAIDQKRFEIGLEIEGQTIRQIATIYLTAQRFLYQLRKDHGSLKEAQSAGEEGKVALAIALQSRESVANKTWDGGLQGTIGKLSTKEMPANTSKRQIQKGLGSLEAVGGIVGKISNGGFKVPLYDVNIATLLLVCECCERMLIEEHGFEAIPSCFAWLPSEFMAFIGERYNRLREGERPMADGNVQEQAIALFNQLFPDIQCEIESLDQQVVEVLRKYSLRSPRRIPEPPCTCVVWDVNLDCLEVA